MAALVGFDTWIGSAAVTLPITVAASLVSVALPAQAVVAGIDLDVSDLDANAVPLVRLNVGDTADADRFIVASTIARTGGMVEYRPLNSVWYRYTAAASVAATVHEAPVTGVAGAIAMTVYGYLAVDRAVLIRQTLQRLGVVAEGEAPRAEDAALALEALRDAHEMLRGKNLANRQDCAWTLEVVPFFVARPYVALGASLLADTFGLSAQRVQRLEVQAVQAEREIRRQTYKRTSGEPVSLEPYREPDPFTLDLDVLA